MNARNLLKCRTAYKELRSHRESLTNILNTWNSSSTISSNGETKLQQQQQQLASVKDLLEKLSEKNIKQQYMKEVENHSDKRAVPWNKLLLWMEEQSKRAISLQTELASLLK